MKVIMSKKLQVLPIGIASFEKLRTRNCLYVDKTEYVYNLATQATYYFLSRPRRFGKSLFLSTLKALFEGKKALFEGLWIASSDYQWKTYPIIHLDLFTLPQTNAQELEAGLGRFLQEHADLHSINLNPQASLGEKLSTIVKKLAEKNPVVVLIDEYDYPILTHISDKLVAEKCRIILQNFYATLKGLDNYLRFVFLTGVTKFAKTSIFSGLNNLQDLTMSKQGARLLGYTREELLENFDFHIMRAAQELEKAPEEIIDQMTTWYDGYQFSAFSEVGGKSAKVYNPWSVLLFFSNNYFDNYWFETGSPHFFFELMEQQNFQPIELNNLKISKADLASFQINQISLPTLLYQTGYLTIESYNSVIENYHLTVPNKEVENSLFKHLMHNFSHVPGAEINNYLKNLKDAINDANIDLFCKTLQAFFAQIPSLMHVNFERYYQSIVFMLTKLIGFETIGEDSTNLGRIDLVIQTQNKIYLVEFKTRGSAQEALQQIEDKQYAQKYLMANKKIVLVGIFIDVEKRNITEWVSKTL